MMDVPVLETERLIMRGHRPEDLAESCAMWADPDVVRFIGARPLGEEDVWLRLLRYAGNWALLGYGFWRCEDKATGAFVGEVGFHELKRDTQPRFAGVPEIGWGLVPAWHGRGLASEAVAAALGWGDRSIASDRVVCIIHPDNAVSIRLALAQGFVHTADTLYKGGPMAIFDRVRRSA